jgi:chromosome condensin MukBEF ATPase and DNA-binding subunit MukB
MLQLWRDLEQYERFKQEDRPLELLHLKIRTLIRDITAALAQDPENQELQERRRQLQEELADLERRAPWIVADYPVEMRLWGPGAGVL